MTKKQKQLIDEALTVIPENTLFSSIYIINSGKDYNGFWGKNGYRQIIGIGVTEDNKKYLIKGSQYDVLEIQNPYDRELRFEIPKENDCLHLWIGGSYKIKICFNKISNLVLRVVKINDR